jgi:hypothetical protein
MDRDKKFALHNQCIMVDRTSFCSTQAIKSINLFQSSSSTLLILGLCSGATYFCLDGHQLRRAGNVLIQNMAQFPAPFAVSKG